MYLMTRAVAIKMKNMNKGISIALLALLSLGACKKELKEIGAPSNKVEGINATWEMIQAIQIDEKSLTREAFNLTPFFIKQGKMPNITFSADSFTVDTAGVSINFFGGTKGTWAFDNTEAPSAINFTPADAAAFTLNLGGPIRPGDNLKISKLVKAPCKGDSDGPGAVMSFVLTFNRK